MNGPESQFHNKYNLFVCCGTGRRASSTIDIIYLCVVEQAGEPVLDRGAQCEEISRDTALPCSYLCYKIIIKNGFPRNSQPHRNLPTKVRFTPRGNYRQRLGSPENSSCGIGRSIAFSVASSPKMGRCRNCTGDFL